jgi:hypothetical protein
MLGAIDARVLRVSMGILVLTVHGGEERQDGEENKGPPEQDREEQGTRN